MFTNKNNTHFTAYVSSQGLVRLSLTPSQSRVSSKSVIDIFAVCILVWLSCELISLQMMQNIQIACCTNSMSNFFSLEFLWVNLYAQLELLSCSIDPFMATHFDGIIMIVGYIKLQIDSTADGKQF
jgi:hypothetical protein